MGDISLARSGSRIKVFLVAVFLGICVSSGFSQTGANVPSQAGALRVNSPQANQRITQNFVHFSYQLVNRGASAAPSPNFTVQLDGTDPITTTASDYTFTGLTSGPHTVTVTLVDANGVPIADSSVAVKFTVLSTPRGGGTASRSHSKSRLQIAATDVATPLPLFSLVGFFVLVGEIWTAIHSG